MKRNYAWLIWLIVFFIALISLGWYFGLFTYVSLDYLKSQEVYLQQIFQERYFSLCLAYIAIYALLVVIAFPVVGPLAIFASYFFGFFPGLIFSITGGTLGSVVAFLMFRYLFFRVFKKTYGLRVARFNEQMKRNGALYLLMLQFFSVIPYAIINMLAALADVRLYTFTWTTLIGGLPLLTLYALAGERLRTLGTVGVIFSPWIIFFLSLLILIALSPLIYKKYIARNEIQI